MTQPPSGGYPPPYPGSDPNSPSGQNPPGGYPPPAPAGPGSESATGPTPNAAPGGSSGATPVGSSGSGYPPPGGYPPPPPGGYPPPPPGGYPPPQQGGYQGPPQGGYPPPPQGGYPPPPQQGSYLPPPQQGSYPAAPQQGGYGPPQGGYPPAMQGGYQQGGPGYPQGQGGFGGSPAKPTFDTSKVGRNDWIVIAAGVVLLIFSFFGWLSVSYSIDGLGSNSNSAGAWHEYWWLATVLGVAVSAVVAARTMMGQAIAGIKPLYLVVAAGAGALITLIALIEIFNKNPNYTGISSGPGVGIWVCLIVALVQTYFVWLWAQKQPGTKLPTLPGPTS